MRAPQRRQSAPRRRGLALALLAALAPAGCAIGPNYERPELPAPPVYRDQAAEAASIADLPWFEVFRDDALVALVREALDNNRDLLGAAARVEQARGLAAVQRGELFPQLDYEGDAAREYNSTFGAPTEGTGTESGYFGVLNAFWEIDVWGRIRRASEAARAEMLANEAFRRGVWLSLVTDTAQAYFELRSLDLELEIAQRTVETFRETRDLFYRQFTGGVTSKLDYLRGEAALAQAAAVVPEFERAIVAKENQLSVLCGRPAGAIVRGAALTEQPVPPEVPPGVPLQLLERRPDVLQAEQTLVAQNARIGVELANFFPRIGLTAFAGGASGELSSLLDSQTAFWSFGGSFAGPLLTWGQTWYTWEAAKAGTDEATLAYQQTLLIALQEVSDALTAREKLAAVRIDQERAVSALAESLHVARVRYLGGLATYLEVLDAQQQLFPTELDLARTRRDELLALVALYRALGGGWSEYAGPPDVPTPLRP